MSNILRSFLSYRKSPCTTPLIPSFGNSSKASFNFTAKSPLVSASTSAAVLYTLGFLLKIPFLATKNFLSLGSIPANIAGAPSHLTDTLTFDFELPCSISLKARRKSIAERVPLTPRFKIESSRCSI